MITSLVVATGRGPRQHMTEASIGLSVFLNLLVVEISGISAGGVVVPGYLAFYLDQPARLAATFGAALLTLLLVLGLARITVLYGRRKFAAMLLVGFLVNMAMSASLTVLATSASAGSVVDLRAVGFLVPGLIANEMSKQGILITIAMTMIVTVVIRIVLNLIFGSAVISPA